MSANLQGQDKRIDGLESSIKAMEKSISNNTTQPQQKSEVIVDLDSDDNIIFIKRDLCTPTTQLQTGVHRVTPVAPDSMDKGKNPAIDTTVIGRKLFGSPKPDQLTATGGRPRRSRSSPLSAQGEGRKVTPSSNRKNVSTPSLKFRVAQEMDFNNLEAAMFRYAFADYLDQR